MPFKELAFEIFWKWWSMTDHLFHIQFYSFRLLIWFYHSLRLHITLICPEKKAAIIKISLSLSLSISLSLIHHNMEVNFHSYSDKSGIAWWVQCWWITTHINKVYEERSIALLSHKNQSISESCINVKYSTNYLIFCIILNTKVKILHLYRSICLQESVFKVHVIMCLALHKSKV